MISPTSADVLLGFLLDPRPGLLLTGDPLLRERLLAQLVAQLQSRWPIAVLPRHAGLARLQPSVDPLAALRGEAPERPGLLAQTRGGVLVIPAADLLDAAVAATAAQADSVLAAAPLLEAVHPALADRLTAVVQLGDNDRAVCWADLEDVGPLRLTPSGQGDELTPDAVVRRAWQFGLASHALDIGAAALAAAIVRAAGNPAPALDWHVFAPRAHVTPPPPPPPAEPPPPPPEDTTDQPRESPPERDDPSPPPPWTVFRGRAKRLIEGRRGAIVVDPQRGRAFRTVSAADRRTPISVEATILAAAPWQRARGWQRGRLIVRPQDVRGRLRRRHGGRLTIFVVDASGSMARSTIRQAKSMALAVLARSYTNRDRVAIVVARGDRATIGLSPTRSITRARTCLRTLPTGGGTPLASGLVLAAEIARRHERTICEALVLTDGRANIGIGGDPRADAVKAAQLLVRVCSRVEIVDVGNARRGGDGALWLRAAVARVVDDRL